MLGKTERERRADAARAAAMSEAMAAWKDGWRAPRQAAVCEILCERPGYLARNELVEVVNAEFNAVTKRQHDAIVAEAKEMIWDLRAGRLRTQKLSLGEVERRLGCRKGLLSASADHPGHRLCKTRKQCLDLWEAAKEQAASPSGAPTLVVPTNPQQQFCRCCNTSVLGKETIKGFLPECWAEYQQRVAIDEGQMSRLSA